MFSMLSMRMQACVMGVGPEYSKSDWSHNGLADADAIVEGHELASQS